MRPYHALALLLLPAAAACGGSKVAPVSGRITLEGKALANAHVTFQPVAAAGSVNAGSGSWAVTDADGRYVLRTVHGNQSGASVGKHRVEIVMRDESDDDANRHAKGAPKRIVLPAKYNRETQLSFEVRSGGAADADFDLKPK